jgi:hypothetical protein
MKVNIMDKLETSLFLGKPVETTGGQICENILQEWIRIVEPSSFVCTTNGNDSPQKRLNSDGRTIFFPGSEQT